VEESAELLTELEGISKMLEAFRKKLANTLRSVAVIAVGFILIAFCF
jgi:hypothetical protein